MQMDYLRIALDDIQFLEDIKETKSIYNNANNYIIQINQIVEKLFKHSIMLRNENGTYDKKIHTYKLTELYRCILSAYNLKNTLDFRTMLLLEEFQFGCVYTGDKYVRRTKEDFDKFYVFLQECIQWLKDSVLDSASIRLLNDYE